MVPYGEFSAILLLSCPRNYVLCPSEFKRTGPLEDFRLQTGDRDYMHPGLYPGHPGECSNHPGDNFRGL